MIEGAFSDKIGIREDDQPVGVAGKEDEAGLHDPVGVGGGVPSPVLTMRVSMPALSMCCWYSVRDTPDSGRIMIGNMCQPVSTPGVRRGSTNTSSWRGAGDPGPARGRPARGRGG